MDLCDMKQTCRAFRNILREAPQLLREGLQLLVGSLQLLRGSPQLVRGSPQLTYFVGKKFNSLGKCLVPFRQLLQPLVYIHLWLFPAFQPGNAAFIDLCNMKQTCRAFRNLLDEAPESIYAAGKQFNSLRKCLLPLLQPLQSLIYIHFCLLPMQAAPAQSPPVLPGT